MEPSPNNFIVQCMGCEARVRAYATRMEPTGKFGDPEIWCLGCLDGIDSYSANLIPNKQEALEDAINNVLLDEE